MEYYRKYYKYKNKYLQLQSEIKNSLHGGFIKTNTKNPFKDENFAEHIKIEDDFVTINKDKSSEIIKSIVDYYMPIPNLYEGTNENFILIDHNNYILIDYKKNDDYILLQLTEDYRILILNRPYPEIKDDNMIIENLDSPHKLHDIFESYYLYSNQIFLKLVKLKLPEKNYSYYNKLINLLYIIGKTEGAITKYNESIDLFVLKLIFMNRLSDIIGILNNFDTCLAEDTFNYADIKRGDVISFTSNEEENIECILIEYIYLIKNKYNNKFDDKNKAIKIIKTTIESLPDTIDKSDCIIILKIFNLVYDYVNSNLNIIYSYNYAVFINQYDYNINRKLFHKGDFKNTDKVMNKEYNKIKHSLIFELIYLLYILYKSNKEFLPEYKISQYLLIDYFFGCTINKQEYLPINKRSIIVSLRNDGIDNRRSVDLVTLPVNSKYNIFKVKNKAFIYISQTKIYSNSSSDVSYVDCGETTLLNMFNYFLIDSSGNITIKETWNQRLKLFYKKWNNISKLSDGGSLQQVKNEWGQVIENIPELVNDENSIYCNDPHTMIRPSEGRYNIRPSLENIIKISKILLNLKGNITIVDIISDLASNVEGNQIKFRFRDSYEIVDYFDISLKFNIGHSEFHLNKSDTSLISYINNNKMKNIFYIFNDSDIDRTTNDKDLMIITFRIKRMNKEDITQFNEWYRVPDGFWDDYTIEDLCNLVEHYPYKLNQMPDTILNRIPVSFYLKLLKDDMRNITYFNELINRRIPEDFFVSRVKERNYKNLIETLKYMDLPQSIKIRIPFYDIWNSYSIEDLCNIIESNFRNIDFNILPAQILNKIDIEHFMTKLKNSLSRIRDMPDVILNRIPLSFYQKLLQDNIDNKKYFNKLINERIPIDQYMSTLLVNSLTNTIEVNLSTPNEVLCRVDIKYLQRANDRIPGVFINALPKDLQKYIFLNTLTLEQKLQIPLENYCDMVERAIGFGRISHFPNEILDKIDINLFIKLFEKSAFQSSYSTDELFRDLPELVRKKMPVDVYISFFKMSPSYIKYFVYVPKELLGNFPIEYLKMGIKYGSIKIENIPEHLRSQL